MSKKIKAIYADYASYVDRTVYCIATFDEDQQELMESLVKDFNSEPRPIARLTIADYLPLLHNPKSVEDIKKRL